MVVNGASVSITREMVPKVSQVTKRVFEEKYLPGVIEPSFGIGRIMAAIFEHCYNKREGEGNERRGVLSFPPRIAPAKVALLPLSANKEFMPALDALAASLNAAGIPSRVDASTASVGKRYSRSDEIGVPLGVTIDFQTAHDDSVTMRDRDSMTQVRLPLRDVLNIVRRVTVTGDLDWAGVCALYPMVARVEEGEEEAGAVAAAGAAAPAAAAGGGVARSHQAGAEPKPVEGLVVEVLPSGFGALAFSRPTPK